MKTTFTLPKLLMCVLACSGFFSAALPLPAGENTVSLVIAPPPIGYPVMEKKEGTSHSGANLVYSSLDRDGTDMTFFGASGFGGRQYCPLDRVALNLSLGATFLAGSEYGTLLLQLPAAGSLALEVLHGSRLSLFAFGGCGLNAGLMRMTITVPQWVPYTATFVDDDTSVGTTMITASATGGLQANVHLRNFVVSPFGVYAVTRGQYRSRQTSTMSYEYPDTTGTIGTVSSTVFGFEVLYVPRGITLSSQLRQAGDYTLFTLAFKWLSEPASPGPASVARRK